MLFSLPEGDGGAGWVAEDTHVAVAHDFADFDDNLCADGFGFGGGVDFVADDVG
jgi:hypothetical protein